MSEGQGPTGIERHKILEAPAGGGGGFGASERFTGPDGRPWAKWLVESTKEYNAIADPELKELVANLARKPDSFIDTTYLRNSFQKIEELRDSGKIGDAEEAKWGLRIAERAEAVQYGEERRKAVALAEAQGIVGPEKAVEEFRDAEEYLRPNTVISPGNEPRFWVLLNEEEKKQTYVRSTLMIIGYKKELAPGTDKLYMDEMRELPVDLDKEAMKVIFKKEGVLAATGIYSTIIGDPKFLAYKDKFDTSLKTVFCSVVTEDPNIAKYKKDQKKIFPKESDEVREKKEKWNERARKLKQFYSSDKRENIKAGLKKDYGNDILTRDIEIGSDNKVFEVKTHKGLEGLEKELRDGTPDSFYRHDASYGTSIDRASLKVLKKAIRYWLVTEGRDLLLSDEEKKDRERFFGNKKSQFPSVEEKNRYRRKVFKELCARARDAEQIAWNFAYATNMLETFDSRAFRPLGTPRHSPSFFWNLHIWVPFHPQERLEQKIHRKVKPRIVIKGGQGTKIGVMNVSNLKETEGEVEAGKEFEILDTRFEGGKTWIKIQYDDTSEKEGWIEEKNYKSVEKPDLEAKEDWSVLGTPLIYNLSHGRLRDKEGRFKIPEEFRILPDSFIRGPLFKSLFEGGRNASEVPVSREESASFYSMLNGIGNNVLYRTNLAATEDLFNRINWNDVSDNAFVPFNFDEMRWADVVVNVLKKGTEKESKVSGADFGEAVRNLRLNRVQREKLLLCYYPGGVNPRASRIAPRDSFLSFAGWKADFVRKYPNYFLEK